MLLSIGPPVMRKGETVLAAGLGVVRRPTRAHPAGRICAAPECDTRLSIYNPDLHCSIHEADTGAGPEAGRAA